MAKVSEQSTVGQIKTYTYFKEVNETNIEGRISDFLIKKYIKDANDEYVLHDGKRTFEYKLTTNLKEYLQEQFQVHTNQELQDKFGEEWSLSFGNESDETPDEKSKKIDVNIGNFDKFLNTNFDAVKRVAVSALNSIRNGVKIEKATMAKVIKLLVHPKLVSSINHEKYEEMPTEIIDAYFKNMSASNKINAFIGISPALKSDILTGLDMILQGDYKGVASKFNITTSTGATAKQKEFIVQSFIKLFYKSLFPTYMQIDEKIGYSHNLFGINRDKSTDLILVDNFGAPTILEIKLPSEKIFAYDKSHKKVSPSKSLSFAISQTLDYMFGFAAGNFTTDIPFKNEYSALSKGILLIGDLNNANIMNEGEMADAMAYYGDKQQLVNAFQTELLTLRNAYANLSIVTYDQLYEFLKKTNTDNTKESDANE